jgi:hypothetical protein
MFLVSDLFLETTDAEPSLTDKLVGGELGDGVMFVASGVAGSAAVWTFGADAFFGRASATLARAFAPEGLVDHALGAAGRKVPTKY